MEGVRTELAKNSVGLWGVLMQGIATIAPAFAIVSTFVFTVGLAGLAAPLAYLLAGALLLPFAVSVNQLAKAFPSAGGWYAWTAYRGIRVSERVLVVTGLTEMAIMVALALHGFASPGPGGLSLSAFDPT